MLELGVAVPYAPALYRDPKEWPELHEWLIGTAPQPLELPDETPEVLQQQAARIEAAFQTLRDQIKSAGIEAAVLLTSDDGRLWTGVQTPQICTFLVDELWGSMAIGEVGEPADRAIVRHPSSTALANFVHTELVAHEFDLNYAMTIRPIGQPDYGLPIAAVGTAQALFGGTDIPVVLQTINTRRRPAPTGHRAYALGQALAEVLSERPEKIAVVAAGGMTHDWFDTRGGWVDYPMDEWVLKQLARGKAPSLTSMFDLESDAVRGGAAEFRQWLAVAGACEARGSKATVVDYFPSYHAATGIGFAYWR